MSLCICTTCMVELGKVNHASYLTTDGRGLQWFECAEHRAQTSSDRNTGTLSSVPVNEWMSRAEEAFPAPIPRGPRVETCWAYSSECIRAALAHGMTSYEAAAGLVTALGRCFAGTASDRDPDEILPRLLRMHLEQVLQTCDLYLNLMQSGSTGAALPAGKPPSTN